MIAANDNRQHVVQVDLYVARRRRVHQVIDPDGDAVFHDPHIIAVFDWLTEQGINRVRLTDDDKAFTVAFDRCPLHDPPTGENRHG